MKKKQETLFLGINLPAELKKTLEHKAKKYHTDMTTLTKLILTCGLKQI